MELLNPTPLPGVAFRQFDRNGDLDCVVALRGTFLHVQDGLASWREVQMPFQWQDTYEGDPQFTSLLHQSDLVPEKVGTDVTFLGSSHAPDGMPMEWECGLEIGTVHKVLHVTGPRFWQPNVKPARWTIRPEDVIANWELTSPEPTKQVAIDWRYAWGGSPAFTEDADPDDRNRIGIGRLGPAESWRAEKQPAPQIADGPILPTDDNIPAGLGPIPPFWQQRYRFSGTYDDSWRDNRHPLLPEDFDPRFWQCAPEDQIAQPFLRGDEDYRLTNLHPDHAIATGQLPGMAFAVRADDAPWQQLVLDGVQFDWRDEALILLTWRTRFPLPDAEGVKLHLAWGWLNDREAAA